MPEVGLRQQMFEAIECGQVEPLQVVDKEHEWMVRLREHSKEPGEDDLQSSLRFQGGTSGTRGCSPIINFSSGTTSVTSCPFGPNAASNASRQTANADSLLTSKPRTRF